MKQERKISIGVKTRLQFPGNRFNSLQGKDPFAITSKIVQFSVQNSTFPKTEHISNKLSSHISVTDLRKLVFSIKGQSGLLVSMLIKL